ncbi:MAG: 2-hydroxyacid dehydrogenase [Aquabacterium sp.]
MNILLAGDFSLEDHDAWLQVLRQRLPHDQWHVLGSGFDPDSIEAAVVANPAPGILAACTKLQLIQSLWAGVDKLLRDPTLPATVPLARMVDPTMTRAMAETAAWAVLSLHRGFFRYARQQALGDWQQRPQRRAGQVSVLVLGHGEMGRAVAQQLAGLGYRVSAWRHGSGASAPSAPADAVHGQEAEVALLHGDAALGPALGQTEIVVNLLPLTTKTRGLINAAFLAALPQGAALVNLARGAHVVQADLLSALEKGHLAHAVLDVFDVEPLPAGDPFWSRADVTVLPHVAALTDRQTAADVVVRNIQALRDGAPLVHLVNRSRGY